MVFVSLVLMFWNMVKTLWVQFDQLKFCPRGGHGCVLVPTLTTFTRCFGSQPQCKVTPDVGQLCFLYVNVQWSFGWHLESHRVCDWVAGVVGG